MKKEKYEKTPRQLKKLLVDAVSKSIESPNCALLLSGGVDSISVGLAAHHADKKVHAYSFHLDTHESYDFKKAREVSEYMGWNFTEVVVPTTNIPEDFITLAKMGCSKKTHLRMFRQALYIIKILKKNENNLLRLIKKNKKIKWSKKLNTLKNLNKFYKINKNISKKRLFNKIRATDTKKFKPYIMLHNKKFVLNE